MYGRFVTFCEIKAKQRVWTVKNCCDLVGRSQFWQFEIFKPVQSICPRTGRPFPVNPSIQMWRSRRQTNAIFGVGSFCFIIWNTRSMVFPWCFPRIDAGATDVYRFPRVDARTRVEFELWKIKSKNWLNFRFETSIECRSPWFCWHKIFDSKTKGKVTLFWVYFFKMKILSFSWH